MSSQPRPGLPPLTGASGVCVAQEVGLRVGVPFPFPETRLELKCRSPAVASVGTLGAPGAGDERGRALAGANAE